jgi:octanoyl-[GcvH]:protein N-octanoyltransferase
MRYCVEGAYPQDVTEAFARELRAAAGLAPGEAVLHGWLPRRTFLFTRRDTRAPGYAAAVRCAEAMGFTAAVRESGGEAVPLDEGTVCADLLLPGEGLPLRQAFAAAAAAIVAAVERLGLTAVVGRVDGAYCPGDFDIAVGGRKFAGLAQRRTRQAVVVHSFVLVAGPGATRCDQAARVAACLQGLPAPAAAAAPCPVTSLAEAAGRPLTPRDFLAALAAGA